MIFTFLFMLMVLCVPVEASGAEIPLEDAVQKGLRRAVNFQNQLLDEQAKELEIETARLKKYFSIDSGASYLFKSRQMEISFPGKSITAGAIHNYDLNLSVKQPIYTGDILTQSVKASELRLAIAKNQTLLEKVNIVVVIKSSYFNYHLLLNKKKSLGTLIRRLNLHMKKLEDYYREDLVRKTDVLETRRKLREQEINVEDLNHLIELERINFRRLCGVEIGEVTAGFTEGVESFDASFAAFKRSHPVLRTFAEQLALVSVQGKVVKGEYLPQVSGLAELHYGRPGVDFFKNQWQLYFQGGVSLGFKVFDWNKRKRRLAVLDYGAEKVKNQREDFILDGEKRLRQLFDGLRSVERKMAILDDLAQLADEDARLKEGLYREQQVTNIDYLDALTTAERYISMKNELKVRLELIKVSIKQVISKEEEQ
ncbi:MAG: TolC family protein [bacterium]|nr:TolC family protein [bacterium]